MPFETASFVDAQGNPADVDDGQTWRITDTRIKSYRDYSPISGEISTFREVTKVVAVVDDQPQQ